MTVQAAIDGLGVAMGRTAYVEQDIAKGRLVVPFKITFPVDAGFYLVSPAGRADPPKLRRSGNGCSHPCRASPDIADIPHRRRACDIVACGSADRRSRRTRHVTRPLAAG